LATPTCLTGDPAAIEILKSSPAFVRDRVFVEAPGQAKDLVLCEGQQFSFSDCIKTLEAIRPWRSGVRVRFYAKGGGSVLGSFDRDGRGEVQILNG
jgi:hypothetical protein